MESLAREILEGFGDEKLGEWTENRPQAFHLRRRLSHEEEMKVGDAVDCRGTVEAQQRFDAIKSVLPIQTHSFAMEEIGR